MKTTTVKDRLVADSVCTPTVPELYVYLDHRYGALARRSHRVQPFARIATDEQLKLLALGNRTERFAAQMAWLTTVDDLDITKREQGLSRFRVRPGQAVFPWVSIREEWPAESVAVLESTATVDPSTWWLSGGAVAVTAAGSRR